MGTQAGPGPLGRAEQSSRAVLAMGLFAFAGAGITATQAANAETGTIILITGLATIPTAFVLAYRFKNGFLLLLGLLGLFHWIGSWSSMVGRSTYEFDIQDPRVMAVAATVAAILGLLHRRGKIPGPTHFDTVWLSVGLLYRIQSEFDRLVLHGLLTPEARTKVGERYATGPVDLIALARWWPAGSFSSANSKNGPVPPTRTKGRPIRPNDMGPALPVTS